MENENVMNTVFKITAVIFICTSVISCADRNETKTARPATLPKSWLKLPDDGSGNRRKFEPPSAAMDEAVRTQFAVHTAALSALSPAEAGTEAVSTSHPKDWVPWHADGMIVNFTVDVGGVFGALAGDGTTVVKVTWQQPPVPATRISAPKPPAAPAADKGAGHINKPKHAGRNRKSILFNSAMNAVDVRRMLEPAVQSAIATHKVSNETAFRKNLAERGAQFLTLVKVLDAVPANHKWHVDSLQAQLTVDVQGNVSPMTGIGGQMNIYFDWQKSAGPASAGAIKDGPLFKNVVAFAQSMSALIPNELLDSKEIQKSGFILDQFQVGVGILGGVHIGVAQAQGELQGKIIFKSNPPSAAGLAADMTTLSFSPEVVASSIPYMTSSSMASLFTDQISVAPSMQVQPNLQLHQIPSEAFRQGLAQAIQMATYFAEKARAVDTKRWNVTQIETEFDIAVGGGFALATIEGQGQFVLDFDKPNN